MMRPSALRGGFSPSSPARKQAGSLRQQDTPPRPTPHPPPPPHTALAPSLSHGEADTGPTHGRGSRAQGRAVASLPPTPQGPPAGDLGVLAAWVSLDPWASQASVAWDPGWGSGTQRRGGPIGLLVPGSPNIQCHVTGQHPVSLTPRWASTRPPHSTSPLPGGRPASWSLSLASFVYGNKRDFSNFDPCSPLAPGSGGPWEGQGRGAVRRGRAQRPGWPRACEAARGPQPGSARPLRMLAEAPVVRRALPRHLCPRGLWALPTC